MTTYKFKTGQTVAMVTGPRGQFKIVRPLPEERGINLYRIKSATDGHERVVMEGEIS